MVVRRSATVVAAAAMSLLMSLPARAQSASPAADATQAPQQEPVQGDAAAEAGAVPETSAVASPESTEPIVPAESTESTESVPVIPVAQETKVDAPELEAHGEATHLEDIVVTATKRNQTVREIPATINVMTGEKLESQGARELQDFVDQVPGLQIQDVAATSSRKIVIRGIAPDNTTNQTVGTVLGDVPLGDPIGSFTVIDPDTWDLETVEVLKGPQGTLFGASSLAGLIRYVPKAPQLATWGSKLFAEWVSTKDGSAAPTFGGAVNVPVGSELAFRLSGVIEHRPGVIDFDNPALHQTDADDSHKWSGRAMALWEPTDRLSINASYMSQENRADEAFFVTNFNYDYTRYDATSPSPTRRSFDIASVDARYRFDWATLVSLSAYQKKSNHFDFESSYALASPLGEAGIEAGRSGRDVEAHGVMQEIRLVSPDEGPWTWQGGAFYSNFNADIHSDIYLTAAELAQPLLNLVPEALRQAFISDKGISIGNQDLSPLKARETALFGEITRELGPVNVTLGGRLYRTTVAGTSTTAGLLPFLTNQSPQSVENLNVAGQGFSPKLALAWKASNDILVYGGVSRGFQYGGVNAVAIPNPGSNAPKTYKSSALWSYEAGVRSDWLDRTLRADLTAFYQQWNNAQVSQTAPPAEAYIDNVGNVKVKGLEMSFRYLLPIEGLSLETNGSYLDSKTAAVFTDAEGDDIAAGTTMPNAPHAQGSATIAYAHAFGGAWETNTSLLYTYCARAWGNVEHNGVLDERNMFNFNFSVTQTDLSFAPSLSLIVNNITDQRKIVSSTSTAEIQAQPAHVADNAPVGYTRPRTIILRLGAEFR